MAHFRGTIQGNKGEASRCGSKHSGLITTCNGWDIGCSSVLVYSEDLETDIVMVHITGGSGHTNESVYLGKFYKDEDGRIRKIDEQ